jgi:dienelactone hydrolase
MAHARIHIGEIEAQGFRLVTFDTGRGTILARWYEPLGVPAGSGVIYVGGVGGGFDTPASGLYPRLSAELAAMGIGGLRVQFRDPLDLDEAVFDVTLGAQFLEGQGARRLGFVGHSFGGAVVVRAASGLDSATTVVTLATQAYGADAVAQLPPGCSILLIHGEEDAVLPVDGSLWVHSIAHEPKALRLIPGADHTLDGVAERVHDTVYEWLRIELGVARR